jgi:hypothetical protein
MGLTNGIIISDYIRPPDLRGTPMSNYWIMTMAKRSFYQITLVTLGPSDQRSFSQRAFESLAKIVFMVLAS